MSNQWPGSRNARTCERLFGFLSLLFYARYAQAAEAGKQRAEANLLSSNYWFCFAFLRPRFDEQGDAGDVAVCDVAYWITGLCVVLNSQPEHSSLNYFAIGQGENPRSCLGDSGKPGDYDGENQQGVLCRLKSYRRARAWGTPWFPTAAIWEGCSGQRIWRFLSVSRLLAAGGGAAGGGFLCGIRRFCL